MISQRSITEALVLRVRLASASHAGNILFNSMIFLHATQGIKRENRR